MDFVLPQNNLVDYHLSNKNKNYTNIFSEE